ncbi:MAG: BCCT family transporter [Chromatiaceae bacterium]|nr:BCCT family transporter [Chromatiaceae bacterium]MCF7994562.1 BCCT family transporter [Chromatiaceae bacterium]
MPKPARSKSTLGGVFALSVLICGAIGVWGVLAPDMLAGAANALTGFALTTLDWFFLMLCTSFVVLGAVLALGPYGKIKLGADDDEPEFSTLSWIAMLFAGGMGAGLLFWGPAEPIYHFTDPPGIEGGTPEAARLAMVLTNLHWGLHAWSIYAVCALVIAYFVFRRNAPGLISTPIRYAFRGRLVGPLATAADTLGVVAVILGLAGSLAMGTLQVRAGLGEVAGVPATQWVSILIVSVLGVCFFISASTGLGQGIKILSNLNMAIAVAIMLFILFVGPTQFILETFTTTIGDYLNNLPAMSFRLYPFEDLTDWTAGWTLTYLIWWLAWGPFVGVFIARISRGRTIREFMLGVVLIPSLFSMLWFATFGGAGIFVELQGSGGLADLVYDDVTKALFALFDYLPLAQLLSSAALVLIFIFLVTSADSGTFVVSMMSSKGTLNPSTGVKLIWALIILAITIATLLSGSVEVAKTLAVTGAIPFALVLLLQIVAFLRTLREEERPLAAAAKTANAANAATNTSAATAAVAERR